MVSDSVKSDIINTQINAYRYIGKVLNSAQSANTIGGIALEERSFLEGLGARGG